MCQVLNKFFRLIDRDLDGIVTAEEIMEFISGELEKYLKVFEGYLHGSVIVSVRFIPWW